MRLNGEVQRLICETGNISQMGRAGNLFERATSFLLPRVPMADTALKSFFATLKTEWAASRLCQSHKEARAQNCQIVVRIGAPRRRHPGRSPRCKGV